MSRSSHSARRVRHFRVFSSLLALLALLLLVTSPDAALAAAAPTVSAVDPPSGPVEGGTSVTLAGTNFAAGATVTFNGVAATGVVVDSATQISAVTPAGAMGKATIIVTNTDGQGASLGNAFTYVGPPPSITGITPPSGGSLGGTQVTLTGTGFLSGATVRFDGVLATSVTFVSATEVRATTPAHSAGAVPVQLTNTDGQSSTIADGFTYVAAPLPTVTGVSPTSGTTGGGTLVTITGTNFAPGARVRFGGTEATSVTFQSATQLRATTPARSAGTVHVQVTNPDTQSAQLNSSYTYVSTPAPAVTSVSPNAGQTAGGNTVTITGTGFLAGAQVAFGNNNSSTVTVVSATQITAVVPAGGSGTVGVKVTNTDGKSHTLNGAYTYSTGPTISSVSPASGTTGGGTPVTITGTGFVSGATVRFGGTLATGVTFVSSTQITALTPARSTGLVHVQVTNPNNQAGQLNNSYTYVNSPAPTVTAVSPSSGPSSGGNTVTVTGTGFLHGAKVTFGTKDATGVTFVSTTTLTAVVPAGTADATVDLKVTNTDGKSHTRSNAYSYAGPTITSLSPNTGTTGGGTPVTITGTGFASGATVRFGGTLATGVVVESATKITAVAPARAAGAVTVQVTNPNGQTGHLNNAYTYVNTVAPTITGVTPASGALAGGNSVTIAGTGFLPGATVAFGTKAATGVVITSTSQLTVVVPSASSAGAVDVKVTNTDGKSYTRANAYTYAPGPTLTSISPSSGTTVGGTQVTITGSGFTSGMTVMVGGAPATNVSVVSATSITARTPARPAGAATVEVRTAQGALASGSLTFTYSTATGSIVGGAIPSRGLGLFIFSGGSNEQLTALASTSGCAVDSAGFFATVGGRFVVYLPAAPPFVNRPWNDAFPAGIPANTPLLASCR